MYNFLTSLFTNDIDVYIIIGIHIQVQVTDLLNCAENE